jgi:hypothetical protein
MLVAVIAVSDLAAATCAAWAAADSAIGVTLMPIEHGSRLADDAAFCSAERRYCLAAIAESIYAANTTGFFNANRKSTYAVVEAEKDKLPRFERQLAVGNPSKLPRCLRGNFELIKE